MKLEPIYTPDNVRPVHNLRFDWTGWLAPDVIAPGPVRDAVRTCADAWREEGFELDVFRVDGPLIQVLCNPLPTVSPVFLSGRVKGRIQHALRQAGTPARFSRKLSIRTLGDNTRDTVEAYVRRQVAKSDYADYRFKAFLEQFTVVRDDIRLDEPFATTRGRYWYNLHLVLAVADRRFPITRRENFHKLRDACLRIAAKKGYALATLAIMPDHLHAALRGNVQQSPQEIALAFLNNLSYVMGYNRCWSFEYYAGTFSEYDVRAIRE